MTSFGKLPDGESALVASLEDATPIPRTTEEMLERFNAPGDMFGFGASVLLPYFDFDDIKGHLKFEYVAKVEAGEETWVRYPATVELVTACAEEYMRFAWGKAMDHRGLSAGRSLYKLATWLWMAGDDEAVDILMDESNYPPYGAPALRLVCERYGWPVPPDDMAASGDDGEGTVGPMKRGESCSPGCRSCGAG